MPNPADQTGQSPTSASDRFLVCGLGSLGQYCVHSLTQFGNSLLEVQVTAIDRQEPSEWEVENVTALLTEPIFLGDCRTDECLLAAGVRDCRAVLLVTSNESDNIQAAIAVRRLNPTARIVVRSTKRNLNELLAQQLGNFVAFDPIELPAPAFALASLGTDLLGRFSIGGRRFEVVQHVVHAYETDRSCVSHDRQSRLVSWNPGDLPDELRGQTPSNAFFQWPAGTTLRPGDVVTHVRIADELRYSLDQDAAARGHGLRKIGQQLAWLFQGGLRQRIAAAWRWFSAQRTRLAILSGGVVALLLWCLGTLMLYSFVPGMTWNKAETGAIILLLGGYGDLFGGLQDEIPIPAWVHWASLGITGISLVYILGVIGLVADSLLSARLNFLVKIPPLPARDHVVLVGFRRAGRRIAEVVRQFGQPIAIVTSDPPSDEDACLFPMVVGNPIEQISQVNLQSARALVVLTDDELVNLEVALAARSIVSGSSKIHLIVRAFDQRFSANLQQLLPDARILVAYELSGQAFAAAAFGENIAGLFRLNNHTILAAEYQVEAGDPLEDRLLAEVAYGYGVVPVMLRRNVNSPSGEAADLIFPTDDRRLYPGDRLAVLASINGLRRIERRRMMHPKQWILTAQRPLHPDFLHEAGNLLSRISGCTLERGRLFMESLPSEMELDMYDYQAHRLQCELEKMMPISLTQIASPHSA